MEYEIIKELANALEEQINTFIPKVSNPSEAIITAVILIQSAALHQVAEKIKPIDPAGPYPG